LIAISLIIIAIGVDAWGYWEYAPLNSSPDIVFPYYGTDTVGYYTPGAVFDVIYYFSALGALSVNNPIHVHAELYQAAGNTADNISSLDFLHYYNAIGFTYAFNYTGSNGLPASVANLTSEAIIPLRQGPYSAPTCPSSEYCPQGENCPSDAYFCADGDIIWVKDGPTWDYLWPTNRSLSYYTSFSQYEASITGPNYPEIMSGTKGIDCPGDPNCRGSIITISGVSDTLSVQANLTVQRLTFILMGFSIILLLEIVDSIVSEPAREHPRRSEQSDSSKHRKNEVGPKD
jgi:hypothetical protein